MTLLNPFSAGQTDAEAPIDQQLMKPNIQENLEDLATQIDNISGGGGGSVSSGAIAEISQGGETNAPSYWKRRFHPMQHMLNGDSENPSGFDPEGKSTRNELLTFVQSNDSGLTQQVDSNAFLGQSLRIDKGSKLSFKIKNGINFFLMGFSKSTGNSDSITLTLNGQSVTSLGLRDENGDGQTDSFSSNAASTFYQNIESYYGLDGLEHVVTIENTDSASKYFWLEFIEVGYLSENPTIDETIKINKGKSTVRGTEVTFTETELTFGKTELNGHTGAIVSNNAGSLTVLDGESPAMTQARAEEQVSFSSVVTQLEVKNNFYFPDDGICLLSTPFGAHHMFSYADKTDTTIQTNSLNNLLWQSQPTEDFTPLDGFTGGTGSCVGDLTINYWGTAPILIDSSNDKIDFTITENGNVSTHVATLANGRYAADLVPLEKAFRDAMQAANSINGEYHLKYSEELQLWNIYVTGDEVTNIDFLFGTGANTASSLAVTIGFNASDITSSKSYLGTTEKQHLCCRALERDSSYMYCEDPRIKYSFGNDVTSYPLFNDAADRLGMGSRRWSNSAPNIFQIFVDEDCCGLQLDFIRYVSSTYYSVQVDDGPVVYLSSTDINYTPTGNVRGMIQTGFISFPRGSRKITVRNETQSQWMTVANSTYMVFAGARQYFSKPAYEKLTLSQAVIKTFDISPISLYSTIYGNTGGNLYSPTATDNINTITESGSWFGESVTQVFNHGERRTNTPGDYVDVNFTLVGDGGGIAVKHKFAPGRTQKFQLFLSTSAINEGTDLIDQTFLEWGTTYYDQNATGILGLPAGTYTARFKTMGIELNISGTIVTDTVSPEENKNTVSDITGTGQGISYPINVRRETSCQDSGDKVPVWLDRSGYKEGRVSKTNYSLNNPQYQNDDDSTAILTWSDRYFGYIQYDNVAGCSRQLSCFAKAIASPDLISVSYSSNIQPFIDGVQTLNTYSQREAVKGGSAPSATRGSTVPLSSKEFKLSCSLSAGLVYSISDTRGIKNNQTIILNDGTNKEKVVIASFVVGTSFTIKIAPILVIPGNVTSVEFQGFHTYKIVGNTVDGSNLFVGDAFYYEPLKVSPSRALQRRSTEFKYEKVSVLHTGVTNGSDLYYPVHSDGVIGSWSTSTIEVVGKAANIGYYFQQDLKNVTVQANDISVKISSFKNVPIIDVSERF